MAPAQTDRVAKVAGEWGPVAKATRRLNPREGVAGAADVDPVRERNKVVAENRDRAAAPAVAKTGNR